MPARKGKAAGMPRVKAGRDRWEREVLSPVTAKAPERRKRFESTSGEEVDRLSMYRGRFWTMRQYAGFGDARESNRRYRYLLAQGQTGLSVAFDLPTQMGYDSDNPVASGEVGKVGVAIDSIEDMGVLFDRIPLGKVSTSMTINSTASILLAMYIAVGESQRVSRQALNGTIQNDILKEYIARGTYIYPPAPSMRIITDIFAFCKDQVPKWNTISISGYRWPTGSPMYRQRSMRGCRWIRLPRASPSSSTRTTTSSKR
jgi:methylmalonyl-CoA mutase N-terminal domain/subunit